MSYINKLAKISRLKQHLRGRTLVVAQVVASLSSLVIAAGGFMALLNGHATQAVALSISLLMLLACIVAPLLSIAHHWAARERLENATLAARLTLTRCQVAHNVVLEQTRQTLKDLKTQSQILDVVLTHTPRGIIGSETQTRRALLSVDSVLRKRVASLEVIPQETAVIADSVRMLGLLMSSPNALPDLAKHLEKAYAQEDAATRVEVSMAQAQPSCN